MSKENLHDELERFTSKPNLNIETELVDLGLVILIGSTIFVSANAVSPVNLFKTLIL